MMYFARLLGSVLLVCSVGLAGNAGENLKEYSPKTLTELYVDSLEAVEVDSSGNWDAVSLTLGIGRGRECFEELEKAEIFYKAEKDQKIEMVNGMERVIRFFAPRSIDLHNSSCSKYSRRTVKVKIYPNYALEMGEKFLILLPTRPNGGFSSVGL